MIQQQLDFTAARARRDDGIARASKHADRVKHQWTIEAAVFVSCYAFLIARPFLAENVREHAAATGFASPPDARAWGAAMQLCARWGGIERCGYAPAKSSNCSPKVLWQAKKDTA